MDKSLEGLKQKTGSCSSDHLACTPSECIAAQVIKYLRSENYGANVDGYNNRKIFSVHALFRTRMRHFFKCSNSSQNETLQKSAVPTSCLSYPSPFFHFFFKSETKKYHLSLHFASSCRGASWSLTSSCSFVFLFQHSFRSFTSFLRPSFIYLITASTR